MGIGFIGAGKVGKALGIYFKNHGLNISGYYSRSIDSATESANLTGSKTFTTLKDLVGSSRIVFITVPDQTIESIDREISALINNSSADPEIVCIHVSGAHPSDHLAGIKSAGREVGSMHPLQSFGDPAASAVRLEKAWFTIEGTEKAVATAKEILEKTGGKYSLINAENKPLYHAGACVISNFLVTLMESGIHFFEAAGMERKDIFPAITPLIDATLSNIHEKGTIDALTGPIVRGDFNTVNVHLQALEAQLPAESDFYKSMALKTLSMLDGNRLTHEQVKEFERILEEANHG